VERGRRRDLSVLRGEERKRQVLVLQGKKKKKEPSRVEKKFGVGSGGTAGRGGKKGKCHRWPRGAGGAFEAALKIVIERRRDEKDGCSPKQKR